MPPFFNNNPNYVQSNMGPFAPNQSSNVYLPAFNLENYGGNRQFLFDLANQTRGRELSADARVKQMELADVLGKASRGEGPSVAQEQLKQATDKNIQQAMALRASTPQMGSSGLAQRAIAQQAGQFAQEAAGQGATLRAQEISAAQQQLGGVLGDVRNMDIGAQALTDQMTQFYTQQGLSLDLAQSQANMELQRMLSENYNQTAATMASIGNSIRSAKAQKYSAPWGILSDERLKENVRSGSDTLRGFLDTVATIRSLPNVRSTVSRGLQTVGQKATATGSPTLGKGLTEVGAAIGSPKSYTINKALGTAAGPVASLTGGGPKDSFEGGSAGSIVGGVAGGLISGARPHAADRQYVEPVMTATPLSGSPSTAASIPVAGTGNTGEIPQNKGIIGAVVSALASGLDMKENVSSAQPALENFLSSVAPSTSSTAPKYTVQEPEESGSKYGRGLFEGILIGSDEEMKKNKGKDEQSLRDFLNALKAYEYDYKNPELDGYGRQVGVMAQDLEKTDIGKQFVLETPRGKMVDYGKGFAAILASQAMLNERLNELEGIKKGKTNGK